MFGAGVDYGADVGPVDAPGAHCAWLSQSVFVLVFGFGFGFGVLSERRMGGRGGRKGEGGYFEVCVEGTFP